jgi:hypothetical protein
MKYVAVAVVALSSCGPCDLINAHYMTGMCSGVIDLSGDCPREDVEVWERCLAETLGSIHGAPAVADALDHTYVICHDSDYLVLGDWRVAGYFDENIHISRDSPSNTAADAYAHEASHAVLAGVLGWDASAHHVAMDRIGVVGAMRACVAGRGERE